MHSEEDLMNLLNGKWVGWYEYGLGYSLPYFGSRVHVEVEIVSDGKKFEGKVKEEKSDFAVPSDSVIKGFWEDELVRFINVYPNRYEINEEGFSVNVATGKESDVSYVGEIDWERRSMFGIWEIFEDTQQAQDEIIKSESEGIWLLKRI